MSFASQVNEYFLAQNGANDAGNPTRDPTVGCADQDPGATDGFERSNRTQVARAGRGERPFTSAASIALQPQPRPGSDRGGTAPVVVTASR